MNKENFTWWLHGWLEIQKPKIINSTQLQEIKNHLDLVLGRDKETLPISKMDESGITTTNLTGTVKKTWDEAHNESQLKKENSEIYMTITNHPIWSDKTTYSDYSYSISLDSAKSKLLDDLIIDKKKDIFIIVDNSLKPQLGTDYSNLTAYKPNHLIMAGDFMGIRNVGTHSDYNALYC